MGLFDFFKKKKEQSTSTPNEAQKLTAAHHELFLARLQDTLLTQGFDVKRHPQYLALIINNNLEIATAIIDNPNNHPLVAHAMVVVIHPEHFPNGIHENLAGLGESIEDKIQSLLDNYVPTTFLPIAESLENTHTPAWDFSTQHEGEEFVWHPYLGDLGLQGSWDNDPEEPILFHALQEQIKEKLQTQKINWLKAYVSKHANGEIIGECLLNNEPWDEGLEILATLANTWQVDEGFKAAKQFMVFKRCD